MFTFCNFRKGEISKKTNIILSICLILLVGIFSFLIFEKKISSNRSIERIKGLYLFDLFCSNFSINDFHFINEWKVQRINGYIIIVIPERTCNKCLEEQLDMIKTYEPEMRKKELVLLTIFGALDKLGGEKYLIKMRQDGLLISPAMVMDENLIQGLIYSGNKSELPIYIYADKTFNIMDIFYSDYTGKKELRKWIEKRLK